MLILGRRVGEEVVIADNIRVVVVGIQGNQVKLGFTAPDDVRILRQEIAPQQREAAWSNDAAQQLDGGRVEHVHGSA